ncbi:MAG TPA: hypothetical protein VLV49_15270 [Terriglobales bacterium]|nr:hypothetical protein [Terriglobales bacterium]
MPNVSGSFSGRVTSQSSVSLPDTPNHDLSLMRVEGVQKCSDPNWNNAPITYWGSADLVAGNGMQRGYFVNEHEDGGRDFGSFEGQVSVSRGAFEGTWTYTGGTGRFQGITGQGTFKAKLTSPTEVENTWEGSYQLAAKGQAA